MPRSADAHRLFLKGVDRSTAAQLVTRLRNEKFIVEKAAPKGKGKGMSQTKKPLSSVSK